MTNEQKHEVIKSYAGVTHGLTFLESGTFRGDTVEAMLPFFRKLISIELFEELYLAATKRFEGNENVSILNGDSGKILASVINEIEGPIVYWLDGHYSGAGTALSKDTQCPIIAELKAVTTRGNPADVILIDDARLFGWRSGYPSKQSVRGIVSKQLPSHKFMIREDIIVICPKGMHSSTSR